MTSMNLFNLLTCTMSFNGLFSRVMSLKFTGDVCSPSLNGP